MSQAPERVRLDKWLWAARFFKTRSLAKSAIEGGKVQYEGARCKVSKEVEPGALVRIRRGEEELEVEVLVLSVQRRGAPEARTLYRETAASLERRERAAAERRSGRAAGMVTAVRPDKKQRRQIHRFQREHGGG